MTWFYQKENLGLGMYCMFGSLQYPYLCTSKLTPPLTQLKPLIESVSNVQVLPVGGRAV